MKRSDQLMLCPFCIAHGTKAPITAVPEAFRSYSMRLRGWCQNCKRPIIEYADELFMALDKPSKKDS